MESEFIVGTFDVWYSCRNESVLRFMLSVWKTNCELSIHCVRNFKMTSGHWARNFQDAISRVLQGILRRRTTNYFFSDFAPVNKAAVHSYMNDTGDEFWFLSPKHFAKLARRKAIWYYLSSSFKIDDSSKPENEDSECSVDVKVLLLLNMELFLSVSLRHAENFTEKLNALTHTLHYSNHKRF